MPKHSALSQGDTPADPEAISEVLGCLEDMQVSVIADTPRLAGSVMSDAALIIRALANKAGLKLD